MDDEYREYTAAKAKAYLQRIRSLNHTERAIRSELQELREMASGVAGIDYSRPRIKSTRNVDLMADALARIESMMDEYDAELVALLEEKARAKAALANIDPVYAELLTYRYIEGKPWADVRLLMTRDARGKVHPELAYSEDHIRKVMHREALCELYPYLPTQWRDPLHHA